MTNLTLHSLLGIVEKPKNGLAWHDLINNGFSVSQVLSLGQLIQEHAKEDTLEWFNPLISALELRAEPVSVHTSDYFYRVARAIRELYAVFGDVASSVLWLTTANATLRHRVPLALLTSQVGTDFVMTAISRLESSKTASAFPDDEAPPEFVSAQAEEEEDFEQKFNHNELR